MIIPCFAMTLVKAHENVKTTPNQKKISKKTLHLLLLSRKPERKRDPTSINQQQDPLPKGDDGPTRKRKCF